MANVPSGLYEVDPISRIEGHLGIKVNTDGATNGATVTEAWAHGNLWRGFENFLIGRNTNDAITFTQRICGVCPLPHATAATFATESVLGVSNGYITFSETVSSPKGVPRKAVLIRNLTYAAEFLMSSITHFYHLAAPSYVQGPGVPPWTPWFDDSQYVSFLRNPGTGGTGDGVAPTGKRAIPENGAVSGGTFLSKNLWSAVIRQYVKALRVRRLTFEAGALFAGRMPMISSYVAGGVTNEKNEADFASRCTVFQDNIKEVANFIFTEYIPLIMALGYLYPEWDNAHNTGVGSVVGLGYGAGCKNFLAWGAFPGGPSGDGSGLALAGGHKISGAANATLFMSSYSDLTTAKNSISGGLVEYITRSRYQNAYEYETVEKAYPGVVSRTVPERSLSSKYSWMKAPRFTVGGTDYPMEVGPLARLVVNGLYRDNTNILTQLGVSGVYLKTATQGTGLDPKLVNADLAVALIREGMATLKVGASTSVDAAALLTLTSAEIVTAYGNADAVIKDGTIPLVTYIATLTGGYSTMDRLRARALEAAYLAQQMIGSVSKAGAAISFGNDGWITGLAAMQNEDGYKHYAVPAGTISGYGVSEAPRGALAHFVTSTNGRIVKYQCVVPTTWNASPKSGADPSAGGYSLVRGPMEQAMIGVPFDDAVTQYNPISGGTGTVSGLEVLRVAQSFDPCIACAVH